MIFIFFVPLFAPAQGLITEKTGITSSDFIGYAIGAAIGIAILYFLVRWIWGINETHRLLQSQINLLKKIAEKQGVTFE